MQANQVTLDARMQSRDALRFTPTGVPALDFHLVHESMQVEAGGERRVACELSAVALGAVAKALAEVSPGATAPASPSRCTSTNSNSPLEPQPTLTPSAIKGKSNAPSHGKKRQRQR